MTPIQSTQEDEYSSYLRTNTQHTKKQTRASYLRTNTHHTRKQTIIIPSHTYTAIDKTKTDHSFAQIRSTREIKLASFLCLHKYAAHEKTNMPHFFAPRQTILAHMCHIIATHDDNHTNIKFQDAIGTPYLLERFIRVLLEPMSHRVNTSGCFGSGSTVSPTYRSSTPELISKRFREFFRRHKILVATVEPKLWA